MSEPWSEEEDAILRQHWPAGWSAALIAKQLSGRSRNSVIGRIHRLGIAERATAAAPCANNKYKATPTPKYRRQHRSTTARAAGFVRKVRSGRPTMAPAEPLDLTPANDTPTATILSVRDGLCRYPIGDPKHEGFGLCGHKTGGSTYCLKHSQLVYQPSQSSEKELARSLRRYA